MIDFMKAHAPARSRDLAAIGVAARAISRTVSEGAVVRIGRGLYELPDSEPDLHSTLIEITKRAPKAVICLTSALSFHQLTDPLPRKIWIAIGAKEWAPKIDYPQIRIVRFRESVEALPAAVAAGTTDAAAGLGAAQVSADALTTALYSAKDRPPSDELLQPRRGCSIRHKIHFRALVSSDADRVEIRHGAVVSELTLPVVEVAG
jgi:hypothetical protein